MTERIFKNEEMDKMTIVQNAVLRLRLPSFCLSVCLSVTLVSESGQHRMEILKTNCTDN